MIFIFSRVIKFEQGIIRIPILLIQNNNFCPIIGSIVLNLIQYRIIKI